MNLKNKNKKIKLAIVSTSVQGERGYLSFDKLAARSKFDVIFVIAGDTSSKPFQKSKFKCEVEHLLPSDQRRFSVSSVIGWRTQKRRSVAFLRALELDPDFILSIDDDNIPDSDYFEKWYTVLTQNATKIAVPSKKINPAPWHNYLKSTDALIEMYPRGFPLPFLWQNATRVEKAPRPIAPNRIGLFQGISLGDPDIDGRTRLVYPEHLPMKNVREKNYCLRNVWSPYNTQNTIFSKIIFPTVFMWPFAERMDDIFASFVWQKILFNNGMYVHVGDAVNKQDRGIRNVFRDDFLTEVEGYVHGHEVWAAINEIQEKDASEFLKKLATSKNPIIKRHKPYFVAHLRDLYKIYG